MNPARRCVFAVAFVAILHSALAHTRAADPASDAADLFAGKLRWTASAPLIGPGAREIDPAHAIKDPTIVFHDGRWHVYATIKCKNQTRMEYLSFTDWKDAHAAKRHDINLVDSYHCAPQVLYFTPQKRWYLIYQWADKENDTFGPCFSTMDDVGKPQTLTKPKMLYPAKPANVKGWLDFWVIADEAKAHLFFTTLDGRMWRAETKSADFPFGWNEPKVVLQADIFEASHTYRLKGLDKYLTIIEAQASGGRRYYKAYLADKLDGQWKPVGDTLAKPFAGEANVSFAAGVEKWTDSISHGELIREGVDETMTVDPAKLRFLFQGCDAKGREGKGYGAFPWRLGMLEASR